MTTIKFSSGYKKLFLFFALTGFVLMPAHLLAQDPEITGFDGWSVVIDPGHSQTENMGIHNFSEAEKVLDVALKLRDMLLEKTDIAEVYLTRDNGDDVVSLSQRTDFANDVAADFYHSIHSDAGAPGTNTTVFLWGGWLNESSQIEEKTPNGGQAMGDIMNVDLPNAMRIGTRGSFADRTFYQSGVGNQYPYLHVNRETNMASVLSEGGFHTNPEQNQLNMNSDYRLIEAQSHFWSYLEYLDLERVDVGILTGVISDIETKDPINGTEVSVNGSTYTTDTYESLFHQYSNDPEQLSNGFYRFDGLEPNGNYTITVEAENYYSEEIDVSINSKDFTFQDVELLSSKSPVVQNLLLSDENGQMPGQNLRIEFNRAMDRESVEAAISFSPDVEYTTSWQNDQIVRIRTQNFEYNSEYTLTIEDSAFDVHEHNLDGDNDGEEGGTYSEVFYTLPEDNEPPVIVTLSPQQGSDDFFPDDIILLSFDKELDEQSVLDADIEFTSMEGNDIEFTTLYSQNNRQGIIQIIPNTSLNPLKNYQISISPGIEDLYGNATSEEIGLSFTTSNVETVSRQDIDLFDDGVVNWWEPQQSGSTDGINTDTTGRTHETDLPLAAKGSSGALRLNYGWDEASGAPYLIRLYRGGGPEFTADDELHAYVHGDGSQTPMRFVARDSNNELEASDWIEIDWIGWKLVRWEMNDETTNAWVNGNGSLDGNLFTDSIQLTYTEGESAISGSLIIDEYQAVSTQMATNINDEVADNKPTSVQLDQNYPNPFNPSTVISYQLPEATEVSLEVYNLAGRLVNTLEEGRKTAGIHSVNFDAGHLSSGVYIYRLVAGNTDITKKMTLIK